jgi:hypothetical protein
MIPLSGFHCTCDSGLVVLVCHVDVAVHSSIVVLGNIVPEKLKKRKLFLETMKIQNL